MNYAVLFYESTADLAEPKSRESGPVRQAWMAYMKTVVDAGIMRGGNGLQVPATATTVRIRDGKRKVEDGPFADTKEQLGGFIEIEVSNLDEALEWAARAPSASTGSVEVRPILAGSD